MIKKRIILSINQKLKLSSKIWHKKARFTLAFPIEKGKIMKNISLFSLRSAQPFLLTLLFITTVHIADAQVIFQEDKNNFIRLVEKQNETDSDMRANQHPFTLHEQDLSAILSAIQVVKNKNTSTPLFPTNRLRYLPPIYLRHCEQRLPSKT